ncbi:radical SAM family heme chaperone HemW [Thermodesulfitimonas sp.]
MSALGLYIHVPFCRRKCNYCDFISYSYDAAAASRYLQALAQEMRLRAAQLGTKAAVGSIYLGGGTPTCLGAAMLAGIFDLIARYFNVLPGVEITVEANPETLTPELLRALYLAGVNRLSIGMQSASDTELQFLGRGHTFRRVQEAVEWARGAGFVNLNLDLVFGLPGQTLKNWEKTLREALALGPEHISAYDLEIHPETPLGQAVAAGMCGRCPEEEAREMYLMTIDCLTAAGYKHYEISNFALPGKECRHNRLYWVGEPYLGLGPAAHSYLEHRRWANVAALQDYCDLVAGEKLPVAEEHALTPAEEMAEALFLGLRLTAGVSLSSFAARFGRQPEAVYGREISRLVGQGLLCREGDLLRLTRTALPVANIVFAAFV